MRKYSKEEIIKLYEECGRIMYQATLDGDYKANNRAGRKLVNIYKYFENNREFAMDCINELMQNENVVIRTEMAAYCLALRENIDIAEKMLLDISSKKENGIFGFNAEKTLEVWREQGYLQIYQKEKIK